MFLELSVREGIRHGDMDRLLAWKFSLPVTHFLAQHFGHRLRGVTPALWIERRDNGHFVVIQWSLGKALSWRVTGFLVLYFAGDVSGWRLGMSYWQLVIRCRSDFGQSVA